MRFKLVVSAAAVCFALVKPDIAGATIWSVGDLTSYTQASWGDDLSGTPQGPAAATLVAHYDDVYASTLGILTVGSASGFTMRFSDASSVLAYMPAIGPFAPLNGNVLNPITNVSGGLGGEVTGLSLNVNFSDAGFLPGNSGLRFGDLLLTDFKLLPQLNGVSVRAFLGDMNTLLSGGSTIITLAELGSLIGDLNASFSVGQPSDFAQLHLVAPDQTSATPLPGALPLFASGLGALGLLGWRRKRIQKTACKSV